MEAKESMMKETGRSGLSIAARPTVAQNSIWPAIVRCSALASNLANSYKSSSILTGMPMVVSRMLYFTTKVVINEMWLLKQKSRIKQLFCFPINVDFY
jgi:integral membrane sensor domain MASE1